MTRPLHRPRPRTGEGDVAALDDDLALPCRQRDALACLNPNLIRGALHRQILLAPDLLGIGVGAQAQACIGRDRLDAA